MPEELAREREPVLRRALRHLPASLLEGLAAGLRRRADQLSPGHLGDGLSGCAVGAMLCELVPGDARRSTGPRGATVLLSHRDLAKRFPRVHHIELVFDTSVELLRVRRPDVSAAAAATAVGAWMAAETQAELNLRHLERGADADSSGRSAALAAPLDRVAPALAPADEARHHLLFHDTVERLRVLRPHLSRTQAETAVRRFLDPEDPALAGAEEPLVIPREWLQEARSSAEALRLLRTTD
jgi:hypothetical protein